MHKDWRGGKVLKLEFNEPVPVPVVAAELMKKEGLTPEGVDMFFGHFSEDEAKTLLESLEMLGHRYRTT